MKGSNGNRASQPLNQTNTAVVCSKRLFRNELRVYKIRVAIRDIFVLLIVVLFVILSNAFYQKSAQSYLRKQSTETMTKISTQISATVSKNIAAWYDELDVLRQLINSYEFGVNENEEYYECLSHIHFRMFSKVGIITESGILFLSSGQDKEEYDISKEPAVIDFLEKRDTFLGCTLNSDALSDYMLFAIPLEKAPSMNHSVYGIAGVIEKSKVSQMLETNAFGERFAYVVISDAEGNVIIDTKSERRFGANLINTFEIFAEKEMIDTLRSDLKNARSNTFEMMGKTERMLMYYTPITEKSITSADSVFGWRLLVLTSPNSLNDSISGLFQESKFLLYSVIIAFVAIMFFCIFFSERRKYDLLLVQSTDPLTGLLNDRRFKSDALLLMRSNAAKYAVVSLNLVQFKMINSKIGRENADHLLKLVAERIRGFLRPDELVSRSFSDRFVVLLNTETAEKEARLSMLEEYINTVEQPYDITLQVTMGVYRLKKADHNISVAMDNARFAQSTIKTKYSYISSIAFYNVADFEKQKREDLLSKMADSALENEEFTVHYQLKKGIGKNSGWMGCEALVRWQNERFGFLPPSEFIELFERTGFIVKLDYYVFRTVCKDIRNGLDAGKIVVPVSVNLSKCNLVKRNFLDSYEKILNQYQIPRELIEFEVTETMVSNDEKHMKEVIDKIHNMGCRCSLDDFGSGYSSFHMVNEFRFDTIKLDASFFRGENSSSDTIKLIVETLINLSHKLNMTVIAEGIEHEEKVEFLCEKQCDAIQGYYFAKPLPLPEFRKLLDLECEKMQDDKKEK